MVYVYHLLAVITSSKNYFQSILCAMPILSSPFFTFPLTTFLISSINLRNSQNLPLVHHPHINP